MTYPEYHIDFEEDRLPYNTHMALTLNYLQKILPLIRNEVLKGLVNSDAHGRVILDINLDAARLEQIETAIRKIAA